MTKYPNAKPKAVCMYPKEELITLPVTDNNEIPDILVPINP